MKRWWFILLAVVLGWFTPVQAFAHTRAVTYDAGPSMEKVVLVAGITMDTYQGSTSEPLSLHKYLYCEGNPINGNDPIGLSSGFQLARLGTRVHTFIGNSFTKSTPGGLSGKSVATALRLPDTITALFPDLVDVVHTEVYEIKPNGIPSFASGELQLEGYIKTLNILDPLKRKWKQGTDYFPPVAFPILDPTTQIPTLIVVKPPLFGVILYDTLTDFIDNKTKSVGEFEGAEIEEEEGEAIELEIL